MIFDLIIGVFLPFFGTCLGAASVFFSKEGVNKKVQCMISGFAAGVMVAAAVWSLLIPAVESTAVTGVMAVVPAVLGFWLGVLIFSFAGKVTERLAFITKRNCSKSIFITVAAIVLHNFPEGMAVGVVYAGLMTGESDVGLAAAFALSLGIAVQNIPEGAIVSLPLKSVGYRKAKAFGYGVLSGVVEPIGALVTIMLFSVCLPILPYLLGFAAGAMLYVVVSELIPEMNTDGFNNAGTICFAIGFSLMMSLDVVLG